VVVVRRRGLCWWVGQLNSRAIVEVRGRDAARFLQGLTTNDLLALPPSPPPPPSSSAVPQLAAAPAPAPHSCYTAFLTPTGRFLADALVSLSHNSTSPATTQARQLPDSDVRSTTTTAPRDGGGGGTQHHLVGGDPEQQSFLVECDARAAPGLVLHLRRYRLRAQVDIVPPAQQADGGWTVGALLTRSTPEEGGEAASEAILQRLRAQAPTLVRPRVVVIVTMTLGTPPLTAPYLVARGAALLCRSSDGGDGGASVLPPSLWLCASAGLCRGQRH
jgi:hypothetical protein